MAIVKSAGLRNYVGKHAGNVYYIQKGVALAREKAAQVTNPRTPSQMMQRVRLANLVNFYRANKEWMKKYAYEKLGPYFSIYNQFVSLNLNANSVPLSKGEALNGVVLPDNLVLTKGTLPTIGTLRITESGLQAISNISLNTNDSTIGAVSQSLINNNDGWKAGDQLSAIIVGYRAGQACAVHATEMILDPESTEEIPGSIVVQNFELTVDLDQFATAIDNGYGVALVHSRREDGKVLVSSENLSLSATAVEIIGITTTEDANQRAIDSYAAGDDAFLDPGSNVFRGIFRVTKEVSPANSGNIYGPDIIWPSDHTYNYYIKPASGYKVSRYEVNGESRTVTEWQETNGVSLSLGVAQAYSLKAYFVEA